ncbi:hypothetical protein Mal48_43480 [Thalassoglobus polymorphus]|uniref:Uncharacterized protein n=1 Tax=Thalassoglobus polymorphus TaxID=2527994 RepID=A0A517QTW1_9PLAN|nr:hypothetical protein Mal48_43480 [Thalassoglobus polymorphus]
MERPTPTNIRMMLGKMLRGYYQQCQLAAVLLIAEAAFKILSHSEYGEAFETPERRAIQSIHPHIHATTETALLLKVTCQKNTAEADFGIGSSIRLCG